MSIHLKQHRIIVTGACGIIGSALCERLSQAGATVIGISRQKSTEPFLGSVLMVGDLLDPSFLIKAFKEACQDSSVSMVIHLAGQSDANQCELNPVLAFEQNTKLTASVLEACVEHHIPRIIYPSTAYVYGTHYEGKINEDFAVHPGAIYTITKLSAEMIIQHYASRGKITADILRIGNVFGPRSKPNTVLGTIMDQAQTQRKIVLRSLVPVRDFIFIDDLIETFIRLLDSKHKGSQVLNVSIGQGVSVGELAQLFCEIWGLPEGSIECKSDFKESSSSLVLDNQRLFERLGWRPSLTLRDSLKKIYNIKKGSQTHAKT